MKMRTCYALGMVMIAAMQSALAMDENTKPPLPPRLMPQRLDSPRRPSSVSESPSPWVPRSAVQCHQVLRPVTSGSNSPIHSGTTTPMTSDEGSFHYVPCETGLTPFASPTPHCDRKTIIKITDAHYLSTKQSTMTTAHLVWEDEMTESVAKITWLAQHATKESAYVGHEITWPVEAPQAGVMREEFVQKLFRFVQQRGDESGYPLKNNRENK